MKYLESEFSLEGRRIIVTGAGGLLGSSFSMSLGKAGAELHLLDIDSDALAKLKSNLAPEAAKASYYEADITDKAQVTSVIDSIAESGSINGLINSAALDPKFDLTTAHSHSNPTAFSSYSLDNWRQSLEVNLTGTFLVTQAVCRHVEQDVAQDCSIINIASTYGITGPDQRIYEDETPERFFKPPRRTLLSLKRPKATQDDLRWPWVEGRFPTGNVCDRILPPSAPRTPMAMASRA